MRKMLLLGCVLSLAAITAPAQAQVASHKQDQDPDSVRAYWTDARMKSAKPLDRAKSGEARGKPGGNTSSWSTVQVNWLNAPDVLKAHGKVFFTDGVYNYQCSGTAVSATVVWTAGHCVNEGPGAFYYNWTFVPAYGANGVQRPYGTFPATTLYTTDAWRTQGEFGRDLGAAHISGTLPYTRGLNTSGAQALNTRVHSYGYPAEGKFNGQNMWDCDTYVDRRDTSASPADYGIPCGMNGGSSGGGWVGPDGLVMSVNSYGYQGLKNVMFGPVQDSTAAALFNSAK